MVIKKNRARQPAWKVCPKEKEKVRLKLIWLPHFVFLCPKITLKQVDINSLHCPLKTDVFLNLWGWCYCEV